MEARAGDMKTRRQRGFSLIELMISLAILTIVLGIVVEGISTMQARNSVETSKLDLTQETREFMDQIVNDLHQSGYPGINMFEPATLVSTIDCTLDNNLACGFRNISATAVQFEGDVDGTGVSEVWIQLVQSNGPNALPCTVPPCVIQRGTTSKTAYANGVGALPPFYTEVNGVMNTTVFSYYNTDGSLWTAGNPLSNIAAVGMTLYVKSPQADPRTGVYPTVTMVSTAKINNKQSL
jgi:prepilin-type N-terminal cleavage/methylation domain-containing protein